AAPRFAAGECGEPDVVQQRKGWKHVGALERAREAEVRDAVRVRAGDVAAVEHDAPSAWRKSASEEVEERGLARAIRADDRVQRAGLDAQAHRIHRGEGAERLA